MATTKKEMRKKFNREFMKAYNLGKQYLESNGYDMNRFYVHKMENYAEICFISDVLNEELFDAYMCLTRSVDLYIGSHRAEYDIECALGVISKYIDG